MSHQVRILAKARVDFDEIVTYIAKRSPDGAARLAACYEEALAKLEKKNPGPHRLRLKVKNWVKRSDKFSSVQGRGVRIGLYSLWWRMKYECSGSGARGNSRSVRMISRFDFQGWKAGSVTRDLLKITAARNSDWRTQEVLTRGR